MRRANQLSTFAATGAVVGLTLAASIFVARNLGPEGRGALLALTFWPAILAGSLSLSINESVAYHVAKASGSQDAQGPRRYASAGLIVQVGVAAVATLLSLALVPMFLSTGHRDELSTVLLYTAVWTPTAMLDQYFKSVLQGFGAFTRLNLLRLVQPVAYLVAVAALVVSRRLDVPSLMAAMLLSLALSTLVCAFSVGVSFAGFSAASLLNILKTGSRFHLANVLLYASAEADKLIVLTMMDDTMTGYYAIAVALSSLGASIVVQSFGVLLVREMAGATTSEERANVLVRNLRNAELVLASVNNSAAALAFILVPLLYGAQFKPAVPATMILLIMGAIKGSRNIMDRALRAMHNTVIGMTGEAIALVGLLVLAPIGAKVAGLNGLAWGLVAAQACAFGAMIVMASRLLKLDPMRLFFFQRENIAGLRQTMRREISAAKALWHC